MLPENLKEPVRHLTHTAVDTLYAIYVVQLIIVIITLILALPFFYFLGFEHVLFFSTLAGLLKIVPILGPSILMAFLAVYAISISDMTALVLLILIGYPVVCAFPDLFIRPVLMGQAYLHSSGYHVDWVCRGSLYPRACRVRAGPTHPCIADHGVSYSEGRP